MNVSRQFFCVFISFNKDSLISPLEQVTGSFPFRVKIVGIGAIDVGHYLGKITGWGFKQDMVMVIHEVISMYYRIISFCGGFKIFYKLLSVSLALE